MSWFTLKHSRDPISERARALNSEIAALEKQIKKLHMQAPFQPQPRLRSTALPHGQTQALHAPTQPLAHEPIFEDMHKSPLKNHDEALATPAHYNDLGVRKYDLVAAWRRFANHFHGPPASNPKLINYLAAGSIQGLRPLRYEKRVARNRLMLLVLVLIVVLTGIFAAYFRHR
jgi:hypothetical protein